MPNQPQKTYVQSPSKLRTLWQLAIRLIAEYEEFDKRIQKIEEKQRELNKKINAINES